MPNIVNVVGGLGNQLFQYAFGQLIQDATGDLTIYDTSDFISYQKHDGLQLENSFDIILPVVDADQKAQIPQFLKMGNSKKFFYYASSSSLGSKIFEFAGIRTDHKPINYLSLSNRCKYYLGYWQNVAYDHALDALRAKLKFKTSVYEIANRELEKHNANQTETVAVHIRQGDYLTLKNTCHLALPIEQYYLPLMRRLAFELPHARFYIFSDDFEAIKKSAIADMDCVFFDNYPSQSAATDLCIMSTLDHIIMSASSFSWWAAALNNKQGRIYAPHPWVRRKFTEKHHLTAMPMSGWILVNTRHVY